MAGNYVKGLPKPDRVQLTRNNPALIRRMGETEAQTMFAVPSAQVPISGVDSRHNNKPFS